MKTLKIYGVLLMMMATACQGFLDEYPGNALLEENTWNSYADFEAHWMSVYSSFKDPNGFSEACRIYGDLQCDLAYSVQGSTRPLNELYTWSFSGSSAEASAIYFSMWGTIGRINNVFDNVPHLREILTGRDSINLEKMLGDMYFIRALCYSELVKYYCEAYDPARAEEQLGMPICTTAEMAKLKPVRVSLDSTYRFMYADLDEAEKRMPHLEAVDVMKGGNYFFTLECVQALRARIALYKGDYRLAAENARQALDYCLDLGMSLGLDPKLQNPDIDAISLAMELYAAMFREKDYSKEILFFVPLMAEDVQGSVGSYFARQPDLSRAEYQPEFVPSNYLLGLYGQGDYRSEVIFERHKTNYSHRLTCDLLFKDSQNQDLDKTVNSNYQSRPKLFRMSELYLIIAEANAMPGGNLQEGLEALNTLKRARIYRYSNVLLSAKELLEEVKKERVRELCFEGFRLMDLKRWHEGFRRQTQLYTEDNKLEIQPDDPRFTWPIPLHELEVNPGMKPNQSN